ncbi:MAG TPA: signal peptidase I [Gemmatimonadaceae bacterium]|nr:signal peptidase I [Gemmatimonadaceae bacterium]
MATKNRPGKRAPATKNVVAAARGPAKRNSSRVAWDSIKSLIGVIIIFLVIRTFFIEAYRIPSGSMEPTLLIGDFLFVNNLAFGPHIPFTHINLPGYSDPVRGKVAIYQSPDASDGNPIVVKRIVGVPGDTLYMRNGLLYVNGVPKPLPVPLASPPVAPNETNPEFAWQTRVDLPNSRFGPPPAVPTHDNWGPFVIPPDHYFSLGDNRYDSKDARYYGFVPRANFRGRPLFIYFSIDFVNVFDWRIRWGRIGQGIH